jgi:hypothetical protein
MWKGEWKAYVWWVGWPLIGLIVAAVAVYFLGSKPHSSAAPKATVTAAWRTPTESELDQPWRKQSQDRYAVARGDFDGDGKVDVARLMLSRDGKRAGIVVTFSNSGQKVINLEKDVNFVLGIMGIEVLPPGQHRTVCGKGYFECGPGEPEVLVTHWDGIDYFMEESADSVYYMPERGAEFRRVWLSD